MGSISALHVCFAKGVMHSAGGNPRASALPCCHAGARCSAGRERTGCLFPRHLYMLGNGRKWLASTLGACSGALLACKCWVPCRSQAPQQLYVVQTPPVCHATAVQAPGDLMSWTDSWRIRLAVRPRKAGHASQLCLAAVQVSDAVQSASASAAHQVEAAAQTRAAASFAEGGQALGAAAADASHTAGQGADEAVTEASRSASDAQAEHVPTAVADAAEQPPSLAALVRLEGWSQSSGVGCQAFAHSRSRSWAEVLLVVWGDTAATEGVASPLFPA